MDPIQECLSHQKIEDLYNSIEKAKDYAKQNKFTSELIEAFDKLNALILWDDYDCNISDNTESIMTIRAQVNKIFEIYKKERYINGKSINELVHYINDNIETTQNQNERDCSNNGIKENLDLEGSKIVLNRLASDQVEEGIMEKEEKNKFQSSEEERRNSKQNDEASFKSINGSKSNKDLTDMKFTKDSEESNKEKEGLNMNRIKEQDNQKKKCYPSQGTNEIKEKNDSGVLNDIKSIELSLVFRNRNDEIILVKKLNLLDNLKIENMGTLSKSNELYKDSDLPSRDKKKEKEKELVQSSAMQFQIISSKV